MWLLPLVTGCAAVGPRDSVDELAELRAAVRQKDDQLLAQRAQIDELQRQLQVARAIDEEDLKRVFYPQTLEIDRLSGGADYDSKPGDDGVTVYLRPIDQYGDVLKVAGDITIQLYDLAAPAGRNLIGEYRVSVDQLAKLWHGRLMTAHFSIKCPWPGAPPEHAELMIRATFVDYLTKRVLTAQQGCTVKLPP